MPTDKRPRLSRSEGQCARCGCGIHKNQLVEPVDVPDRTWVRWCHVGCEFKPGYGMGSDGFAIPLEEIKPSAAGVAAADGSQSAAAVVSDELLKAMVSEAVSHQRPSLVAQIKGELYSDMTKVVVGELEGKLSTGMQDILNAVMQRVEEEISAIPAKVIQIEYPDGSVMEIEGEVYHEKMDEVLEMATMNPREDVFLPGPSGCGKTHLARQSAKVLDLKFGMISCTAGLSEVQLLGRSVPNLSNGTNSYTSTPFIERYENGGVFLLDEADAADPNTLLILNSALANGECAVPNRHENPYAERHPDFICLIAANTYGRGADRLYVGRNELDEAFLDRFRIGTVPLDYSERIERSLCPNKELYSTLVKWRAAITKHRLRRILSTRFMIKAYKAMTQKQWSMQKVGDRFFSGWSDDEIKKVRV